MRSLQVIVQGFRIMLGIRFFLLITGWMKTPNLYGKFSLCCQQGLRSITLKKWNPVILTPSIIVLPKEYLSQRKVLYTSSMNYSGEPSNHPYHRWFESI